MKDIKKYASTYIILCQCLRMPANTIMHNGFMINYLKSHDIRSGDIIFIMNVIPYVIKCIFLVIFARYLDKSTSVKLNIWGYLLLISGFLLFIFPNFINLMTSLDFFILGMILFSFGNTIYNSNWYTIVCSLIKYQNRQKFLGILRLSWQIFGLIFSIVCSAYFTYASDANVFLYTLLFLTFSLLVGMYFYYHIISSSRDLRKTNNQAFDSITKLSVKKYYIKFLVYIFVVNALTINIPIIMQLYQKEVLSFTDRDTLNMGYIFIFGQIVGFWFGRTISGQIGFIISNVTRATILLLILSLNICNDYIFLTIMAIFNFLLGSSTAIYDISETITIIKISSKKNHSLFISILNTAIAIGATLGSLSYSFYFKLNFQDFEFKTDLISLGKFEILFLIIAIMTILVELFRQFIKIFSK